MNTDSRILITAVFALCLMIGCSSKPRVINDLYRDCSPVKVQSQIYGSWVLHQILYTDSNDTVISQTGYSERKCRHYIVFTPDSVTYYSTLTCSSGKCYEVITRPYVFEPSEIVMGDTRRLAEFCDNSLVINQLVARKKQGLVTKALQYERFIDSLPHDGMPCR